MASIFKLGMTMERNFSVDDVKKIKIQKKYIKTNRGVATLSLGLLAMLLIFTISFAIYGIGMKNTFLVQDVTSSDYGEKNLLLVWIVLITVDVIILFLWFIQKIVVSGIYGKFIRQRINESLIISQDTIEYGYQNLVGSTANDRVIVKIPIDSIKQIKIDREIGKIELFGLVSSKYYENYSRQKTRAPKNNYREGSFVIFDYFTPGLIEYFDKYYSKNVEVK